MANPIDTEWLGDLSGKIAEANRLADSDKARRANAAKATNSVIMNTDDLQTGQWDASKILKTTAGGSEWGEQREITPADLARFKQKVDALQKAYKGGILPEQVISLSRAIDIKRAKAEIKNSVVQQALNGKLRFITNSSGKSPEKRHFVSVEFNKELYNSLAAGGNTTAHAAALRLRKSRVLFECDCGRHTFWYRYMATIGKYGCGRQETGLPKIRNPELRGVACKHVIRVMSEIMHSGYVLATITSMMSKAKSHEFNKSQVRAKHVDAIKELEKQAKRKTDKIDTQVSNAEAKRNKHELAKERAKLKVLAEKNRVREANKAAKLAAEKAKIPPPQKAKKPMTAQQFEREINHIKRLGLSSDQEAAMLAILRQSQGR